MAADETSKDAILDQFSTSVHKLADNAATSLRHISYVIAGVVLAIVVLIVVIVCYTVHSYTTYTDMQVISAGIVTIIIVALALGIVVESSVVSARRKTRRIADNATNVISSQEATDLLNKLSTIYINNT